MKHLETNLLPSGFVPSPPMVEGETVKPIKTGNGHSIDSLRETAAFNHLSGNNLDRMCAASNELRSLCTDENSKNARAFAKRFTPKKPKL